METTRASIRDTVEELRDKVGDTLDWRHYVNRYPGASLTVAVALGMLVGRGITTLVRGNGEERSGAERYGYGAYRPVEAFGESALTPTPSRPASAEEPSQVMAGARRAVNQSASRLGSRLEGIVNRVIDELSDAVETALVPSLTSWVRELLDFGQPGAGRRGRESGSQRVEPGGVYTGGPAGPQHYPSQGRTAEG
jgi:hypothetical protein